MPAVASLFVPYRRSRPRSAPGSTQLATPAAPATPNTPSPADTATAYYTRLSWVSGGATKFDVYLDTVNPPTRIVVPKYVGTSYVPTLLPSTTYYWKIVAVNAGGFAAGPVWSFTTPAATSVLFSLAGSIVHPRDGSLSVSDVLGPTPNTGSLTFDLPPSGAEAIAIGLGTLDDDRLIFGGEVQAVDQTYVGTEGSAIYPVTLIDHTFRLNKRRPFGTWTNVSASTIARYVVATFAPGFTSRHVQDGLPAVSITFDGEQDFMTAMRGLATAISDSTNRGKTKVDYAKDVWLYLTYAGEQPDPIDNAHPPLNLPSPIRFSVDHSQIRTRCYGKGHGETVPCDVAAGETIVPIADAVMFTATGGQAIAGTTANGAQSQILTYESVQLGGGGSLVGPGAAPSVAPSLAPVAGTELGVGVYQYAYSDVTAAGESLPSPLGTITIGTTPAPSTAPTVGAATAGGSVDAGTQDYVVTFGTPTGETTPSPISSPVTTYGVTASAPTHASGFPFAYGSGSGPTLNRYYKYVYTFYNPTTGVETGPSPETGYVAADGTRLASDWAFVSPPADTPPTGFIRRWYRAVADVTPSNPANFSAFLRVNGDETVQTGYMVDATTDAAVGPAVPGAGGTAAQTVPLTNIPGGDANATSKNLYRRFNGAGTFKFVATLASSATTYTDTTANASLGASAPSSNTATARRVAISAIAIGATSTTSRNVWRTAVNGSQLKFLVNLPNNTATTFADSTADSSLGANAPTGDTSGLTQPSGQVIAGSTSLPTASAGPFARNGGWVTLSGSQTVRYTGISGNTLTGIPATGAGAITTTVLYGSQVLPAPALVGINHWNGLPLAMATGSKVNIWVQRDDLAAQAALGALERDDSGNPTDGIREYKIEDERSTEATMIARCDADLAIFSRPVVSARYYTRDVKTTSGRTVSIDLRAGGLFDPLVFDPAMFDVFDTWGESGDFTIQQVDLSCDGSAMNPLRSVTATSVAFTLNDLLRRVALTG
jgi:hypothetical protein